MWFVAITTVEGQGLAEKIQTVLERMDMPPEATVIVEIDEGSNLWEVGGYFSQSPDEIALALLAQAFDIGEFVVSEIAEENWQAEVIRKLPPVEVGRFLVHGRHHKVVPRREMYPLKIDASLAFGTGHHATTQMCLAIIDALHLDGFKATRTADIGCGTGILAMAMASLWQCQVDCSDNDPTAIETFRYNAMVNEMVAFISARVGEGAPARYFPAGQYDLVVANILSGPLMELAPDLKRLLRPEGRLVLSGLTKEQAGEVCSVYERHQLNPIKARQQGIWSSLVFARRPQKSGR